MNDQRVIVFVFAGREPNLEVQRPFLDRILRDWPNAEVHYWNLTRNDEDNAYVRALSGERITVRNDLWKRNDWPIGCRKKAARPRWCGCRDCRPAPYEKVYAAYADDPSYADAVFVKLDDDIVFLETERFGDLLSPLVDHPNAVVSANVVNNVASAKHDPGLRDVIEEAFDPQTQREWFDLHADAAFAALSHGWFLANWRDVMTPGDAPAILDRALPGERPSINTIAFTWETMRRLSATMSGSRFAKMGDEGSVCQNFLPRIALTFRSAHLYFGPQRVAMDDDELDELRQRYAEVAAEYLA